MNIYHERLIDHFRNPRNAGTLKEWNFSSGVHNPSCGDSIEIQGMVINGIITSLAFKGTGCVISQASASLVTQWSLGRSKEELLALSPFFMDTLLEVKLGPTRMLCALLSLQALQKGLHNEGTTCLIEQKL